MEDPQGYNVFNTAFMPPKVMVYAEKHELTQICIEIIKFIDKHRPSKDDLEQFIHDNLYDVVNNYLRHIGVILVPPNLNPYEVAKAFNESYNSPMIQYTKERTPGDIPQIIKKLRDFLVHYEINKKDIVIFNFPKDRDEILACRKQEFNPNFVMELKFPPKEVPKCNPPSPDFYQLKVYFEEAYRVLKMPQNLKSVSRKIRLTFKNTNEPEEPCGKFVPRVVIMGRRGSGRKLQANLLAHEFKLVYIDVEYLLLKYVWDWDCPIGRALRCGYPTHNETSELITSIILKRLLKPDCLANGWVIVGFPHTLYDFKLLVAKGFFVPPNKIIFLHTRERVCLRRLERKRQRARYPMPADTPDQIKKEFEFFNLHIRDITAACENRKEAIHIDGNHSINTVKTTLWGRVLQKQRF